MKVAANCAAKPVRALDCDAADFYVRNSFWLAAPARRPSYGVGFANRAIATARGMAQCRALSPDFPAGARGLYPLARGCRIRPARGMAPALMGCWIAGGAGFFLVSVLPGGAVELPGRSRPAPGGVDLRWGGSALIMLAALTRAREAGADSIAL